jgi:hypothetical protein
LSEVLGIRLAGIVWVGCSQHHKAQEGALGGFSGACKLEETSEQPCSDVLVDTPEVCTGVHLCSEYLATQDDHDSWGICTVSA